MVEALTKLHKVKPKNKKFKFYERQISGLVSISDAQAKVEANGDKVGELPRLKEMIEWFKRNAVKDEVSIIHGDYKLDNVIIHPVESKVIGILDWELSTIGHPLSDLANLLLPYYIPSSFSGFGMKSENFTAVGIPEVEELLQHYCSLMERPFPIPNWDFCLSVILQGIAARVKRKQASSEQALQYAKMFKPLAKLGLEIVDRGDLVEQVIKSKI
ncbi:hypothetical protein HK099_002679 [Clydaea vesicula]|uniref:Aminoglycoside phosphotransferase domain-containing protein n=1 Tax=Clydaea vesicula TaxID=447962 RepID=A0AAD5XZ68_9FUNG|nr:hypothetical protein HK099_002679 [Clydaea vesicula]